MLEAVEAEAADLVAAVGSLVQVPSVSGSAAEHEIQAELAAALATDGLEVDHWELPLATLMADADFPGVEVARTEAWGLVGRLPGSGDGPTLMLQGHIDVVPTGDRAAWSGDPFSGTVGSTRVVGRGSCDMKAGVVAARFAVRALRSAGVPLRGDVLMATVAGEEDGGLGTFGLLHRGWRADACVVPEPTGLDVVPACAGALTFRLRIRGLSTHASRRTDGISAIEKLVPVVAALQALERERNAAPDPLMARWPLPYPISLGVVRAGDWASSVPDLLEADGRLGVALDEPVDAARGALEAAMAEVSGADPWLRRHPVEVEWWGGQYAPGRLPADSTLAVEVQDAHQALTGHRPGAWGAPYGSDLRLLSGLGQIPTVLYGPGDAALAHAPDESVPIDEVRAAARALAVLALDVCGTA